MATKVTVAVDVAALDVAEKFGELVKDNLGSESVYIRTKETLQELFEKGNIKDNDRATIISQVLVGLNQSLVSGAMQTALQWSSKEADLEMQRMELEYRLGILNEQLDTQGAQTTEAKLGQAVKRAELMKNYGVTVDGNYNVTDASADGKIDKEMNILGQEYTNKTAEKLLLDAKLKETQAGVHKLVADTYNNFGSYTYTVAEGGVTGVTKTHGTYATLSDKQKTIADEQAKGYSYNAWSNAAQSAATMIGTMLTADVLPEDNQVTTYVGYWTSAMGKLNNITVADTSI